MERIVIADDSRTIRVTLRRILTEAGFEVSEASTGIEAIQRICTEKPAVAILDINMPEMDGYGVCQKLGELGPPWSAMPIVFLTSLESHALEVLGNQMGAYLRKPIDREILLNTVRQFIPLPV